MISPPPLTTGKFPNYRYFCDQQSGCCFFPLMKATNHKNRSAKKQFIAFFRFHYLQLLSLEIKKKGGCSMLTPRAITSCYRGPRGSDLLCFGKKHVGRRSSCFLRSSQVDVESLQDHLSAQRAVPLVDGLLQQDLSAFLAQAKVPAGQ